MSESESPSDRRRVRSPGWTSARWAAIAVFAGAQIFLALDDSPVADEARHVRDGAAVWATGRVGLNPEHPPLVKLLAAAALPAGERATALAAASAGADPIAADARFAVSLRLTGARLLAVRSPVIALSLLGLVAFGSLFSPLGPVAVFGATVLLAAAPPWIAHSHYVTTDVAPVAFLLAAAAAAAAAGAAGRTRKAAVAAGALAGVCAGAAILSKYSAPLLVPFLFVWIWRRTGGRGFLAAALAAAAVTWGVEAFATRGMAAGELTAMSRRAFVEGGLGGPAPPDSRLENAADALAKWSRPAAAYAIGFLSVAQRSAASGGADYWKGAIVSGPQPLYPAETLLVKDDLPLLLLALAGVLVLLAAPRERISFGAAVAILAAAVFTALAARSSLHLGVRHLLPAVVLLAGLGASVAAWTPARERARLGARIVLWGLLAAHVFVAARTFPHELSYRNALGGFFVAPERAWDLGDDWGQDLGRALRAERGTVTYVSVLQYRASEWSGLFPKLGTPPGGCPCLVDRVAIDLAHAARRPDVPSAAAPELAALRPILDRVETLLGRHRPEERPQPSLVRFP